MRVVGAGPRQAGKINTGCVVAVVIAVILAGIGVVMLGKFGLDVIAEQVKLDIRDNPVVLEHVGDIEELSLDFKATTAIDDEDVIVFNVVGSKANAELTATVVSEEDAERVTDGTLRMEDGSTHELFP